MITEHVHLTAEHIGRTVVLRGEAVNLNSGARTARQSRYLIEALKPADDNYRRHHPTAGPRVEATLRAWTIMRDGTCRPSPRTRPMWLPTIGNERTVELVIER